VNITRIVSLVVLAALAATTASPAATPATLKTSEFGHGPTVVFVHGLGGGRMQWMPVVRKMIGTDHVVLVDLPGHGDSTMPDPFSLGACADALADLLAKQNRDSTIVVAQGVGGMIAIKMMATHPGAARGLIAIDAGLKLAQAVPEQQQKYFLDMLDTNYDAMMKAMFAGQGRDSAQGVAIWASVSQVPHVTMKTYMSVLLTADESKSFHDLKGPFEFVGTEKVWAAGKSWADVAKQLGYDETVPVDARRLAGAGAMVATDQPDTLAMLVADFQKRALKTK
jgi:pimeloyl-ACP methyl ester carboxylesterase